MPLFSSSAVCIRQVDIVKLS